MGWEHTVRTERRAMMRSAVWHRNCRLMSLTERFSGCRQSKRPKAHPIGHSRADTDAVAQHNKPNVLCVHARGPGASLMPCRCPRGPFWAAVVVGVARSRWYCTDVPPAAAFQAQSSSRRLRTCIPHAHRNEHTACWLRSPHRSAGRGRSELESRVSPSGRAVTVRMRKV